MHFAYLSFQLLCFQLIKDQFNPDDVCKHSFPILALRDVSEPPLLGICTCTCGNYGPKIVGLGLGFCVFTSKHINEHHIVFIWPEDYFGIVSS